MGPITSLFVVLFGVLILFLVTIEVFGIFLLKFLEQATEGRLKFFNRDFCEPIYSKWPRRVDFF